MTALSTTKVEDRLLDVAGIDVKFRQSIEVLHDLSLHVNRGEIVALLGSNGAGKTTTLRAISSLLSADGGAVTKGTITFDGVGITNGDPTRIVRKGLIQVLEGRRVLRHLTVEQNLVVATASLQTSRADTASDLEEMYEMFPILAEFRRRPAGQLSGGQQQMVVVGRALMARPTLLMLDEPSLGLAPKVCTEIFEKIVEVNKARGVTILLVEQNAVAALEIADRGYVLESGHVALEGSAESLVANEQLREFYLGIDASGERSNFVETAQQRHGPVEAGRA